MKKFVIYIDYKADYKAGGYEYTAIDAENIEGAMEVADGMWNENIYLMRIMKQEGKTQRLVKGRNGFSVTKFTAVLARRSFGWHLNNKANSEGEHSVNRFENRFFDHYEIP